MRRSKILVLVCATGIFVAAAGIAIYRKLTEVKFLGREGVVWQRESHDCGAAALKMILIHFGIAADYDSLSRRLELNSRGTSMLQIKRAAESWGLLCQGWRLAACDLADIPLPAILFLKRNHFVVLDACDREGRITIRDPARGRLQVSCRKLETLWRGETLVFADAGNGSPGIKRWFRIARSPGGSPL
jgi:ABC-type bacteriocin/lantibiotic exporter with double-glycine peptidase domain